jgi:hypothetical protein
MEGFFMPVKFVTAEEFQRLTGERGSWIIEMPPAKRPKPAKKSQEVFLCPHCLELLTSPRSGVLHCALCDKTWG